jgi:hypothetical protein
MRNRSISVVDDGPTSAIGVAEESDLGQTNLIRLHAEDGAFDIYYTGRRFGTLLAHLLPQNATKRHDCALLSHCVYTW